MIDQTIRYRVNDFLMLLSLMRLVYHGYFLFLFSRFGSDSSYRICEMYDVSLSPIFVMRAYLIDRPMKFILSILIILIVLFAYAVQIIEIPVLRSIDTTKTVYIEPDHRDFTNCMWEVILVIFTVGYGEVYPLSIFGRFILFITALLGVTTVSAIVATVMKKLTTSTYEDKSLLVIRRLMMRGRLRSHAVGVIILWWRIVRHHRNGTTYDNKREIFDLNHRLNTMTSMLREYRSMGDSDFYASMFTYFEYLKNQQKDIFSHLSVLSKMIGASPIDDELDSRYRQILQDVIDR
jgi:hypothetical protein